MSEHISILSPAGFKAGAVHAGLKSKNEDIGVIFSEVRASAAAVYTKKQGLCGTCNRNQRTFEKWICSGNCCQQWKCQCLHR